METSELIILQNTEYGEEGSIIQTYSAAHGLLALRSFNLNGGPCRVYRGEIQILGLVSATFELPRAPYTIGLLRRIEKSSSYRRIQNEMPRHCIALLLSEILRTLLRGTVGDQPLFDFIRTSVESLNRVEDEELPYFVHRFIIGLAVIFGYSPQGEYSVATPTFNLRTGRFQSSTLIAIDDILTERYAKVFTALLQEERIALGVLTLEERNRLLRSLLRYLEIHEGVTFKLQSLSILQQVLHIS